MVVLLATGLVPAAAAGLLAAGAMILLGVVSLEQAYRGINWTTVLLIGAMIPLSTAMQATGAAERIATALVDVLGDSSPYLLLRGGVPDPVATPANLMVMEPGGYRFGDYWKLGLPLLVLFLVVAVFLVPVLWRF